ncbi:MAG: type II toxin-antitoxin system Phd/YefM family antitoxin, partial [Acidimicrobiales bacterium]
RQPGAPAYVVAQLYGSYMREMTVSEARDRLADAIDQARTSHEPVVLTRRGRRVAVLVDADDFARMSDLVEDALDRAELEAARAENDYVPWEQVKAELGLA